MSISPQEYQGSVTECIEGHKQPSHTAMVARRILIAALVVVLTFVAAECLARIAVALAKPEQSFTRDFDVSYQLARSSSSGGLPIVDVMGDSLAGQGIYPELLEMRLREHGINVDVRNIAVPGNTPERNLLLLKAAVKSGNAPRMVIYGMHPRIFNKQFYAEGDKKAAELFNGSYYGSCLDKPSGLQKSLSCFMKKNFYLVRHRGYFKTEMDELKTTLLKPEKRLKIDMDDLEKTLIFPSGWKPGFDVYTNQEFIKKFQTERHYSLVKLNLDNYQWTDEQFLAFSGYCQKHNIHLVMLWLPEHPVSAAYYSRLNIPEPVLLKGFEAIFKKTSTPFLNMHHAVSDSTYFHDPDHLNPLGAAAFAKPLADALSGRFHDILSEEASK